MQWNFELSQLPVVAQELSNQLEHTIICFNGPMGVGKTTFIKALCTTLGCEDMANSPTFSLVNTYNDQEGKPIHHFDCYRLNHLSEALDMGIEEYLDSGNYCFIEWPELITPLLEDHHMVTLQVDTQQKRLLTLVSP